ncbi:MAG TPA: hypothetical protein VMH04_06910 [Candidatus Solibacter sp.]|nr:hypothetical protein [Candidatus Solibacter sp.]
MKTFKSAVTWVPIVAVVVAIIWYHNAYSVIGAWILILALYLSNAFERINALEKRIEELESERTSVSSTAP